MNKFNRLLLSFVCVAILATSASSAFAAKKKRKKAEDGWSYAGSAETTKERERRLKRECRGQVNAGACAGYTR